jgi:peptidoglycan/xylan/chitin deacetylase (PgdA/CDA1 family)
MTEPIASLSLDLDNLWSYQMTHGDPDWNRYGTYLDVVVPLFLEELRRLSLRVTVFVVGKDASIPVNEDALRSISQAGHEIGNHSFNHQPWLHRYSPDDLDRELTMAEDAIEAATGQRPHGFRGPGYSLSAELVDQLTARRYQYDCSTLPTIIGPLARKYYFRSAELDEAQRAERRYLFGSWREGLRPLKPYWWDGTNGQLLEIPVSVMPLTRVPFHVSYVLYLAGRSTAAAVAYFTNTLRLCKLAGVEPSILLHPLDFLGADDVEALGFFPGMSLTGAFKRGVVRSCLEVLSERYDVVALEDHARSIRRQVRLPARPAATASPTQETAELVA